MAMLTGLAAITILAIALTGRIEKRLSQWEAGILLTALGVFIVVVTVSYLVVRHRALGKLRQAVIGKSITPTIHNQLAHLHFTLLMILMALLEGWGLVGAVMYLIAGAWPALAAPAAALVAMLLQFPSQARLDWFISDLTGQAGGAGTAGPHG